MIIKSSLTYKLKDPFSFNKAVKRGRIEMIMWWFKKTMAFMSPYWPLSLTANPPSHLQHTVYKPCVGVCTHDSLWMFCWPVHVLVWRFCSPLVALYVNLIFCFSIYRPFVSPSPASLRVSSVSVVRSDHSTICVSWRPVSAVDGYRIVIQSVKGNPL